MVYDLNFSGLDYLGIANKIGENDPTLFILALVFEFFIIAVSGPVVNKKFTGYSNISSWLLVAGTVTTISAFLLNISGLIDTFITVSCLAITIVIFIFTELGKRMMTQADETFV